MIDNENSIIGEAQACDSPDRWNLELSQVLRSAKKGVLQPHSLEVCDAFSRFLEYLRTAADSAGTKPRHPRDEPFSCDERFSRDDGVVLLNAAFDDMDWFVLWGHVWWIDQTVDPVWARLQVSQDIQARIANYTIKCGVLRPGDAGYSRAVTAAGGHKYLKNLLEHPTDDQIEDAWISEQLTPESDLWFFEFSNKSCTL